MPRYESLIRSNISHDFISSIYDEKEEEGERVVDYEKIYVLASTNLKV